MGPCSFYLFILHKILSMIFGEKKTWKEAGKNMRQYAPSAHICIHIALNAAQLGAGSEELQYNEVFS